MHQARAASLPAYFDLRPLGKLTPVRDQGSCGSCWIFATCGSLESCLLTDETWDFSENNMKNTHGFDYLSCSGGNEFMSMAYLTRWSGPINEKDDPYNATSSTSPAGLSAQKHVQKVILIPDREDSLDNDNIKQAIINYGAVYTSLYWGDSSYNSIIHSYYYFGQNQQNHAVCIVGWDDNYSRSNFVTPPAGNGAFIIKNNWGPSFGDGGYFYLAYYDTQAFVENTVFVRPAPITNYNGIYQYDPLGWVTSAGFYSDVAWFANVFTSKGWDNLVSVSFYNAQANSSYEIFIYKDPGSGPVSGGVLAATKSGVIESPGYETIALDAPIPLEEGEKFSVVVKLITPGYNYPIPMEYPYEGYASHATANPGESYGSADGINWTDFTDFYANTNVCIKAFTSPGVTSMVTTPSFNPDGGEFIGSASVTIACDTPDAEIHYSTSGAIPTQSDPVIQSGSSLSIDHTITLKARAWKQGWVPSDVKSAVFTIAPLIKVVYVKPTGSDSRNGLSWANAKKTIRAGIGAASQGDEIWVANGTYLERITLKSGVAVYGGFVGNETNRLFRAWKCTASVIDGGRGGSVVTVPAGATDRTLITNFTIKGGQATYGAGIYCVDSSPVIVGNIIRDNKATYGGGIYCTGTARPTIVNNTIVGNTSGGGIMCAGTNSPIIVNNIVAFGSSGISRTGSGVPNTSDNCVYGNSRGDFIGLTPGAGDMRVDPQFIARTSGNYHLMPTSPCADNGNPTALPQNWLDMDGQNRIYGDGIDIGADEIVAPVNQKLMPDSGLLLVGKQVILDAVYWDFGGSGVISACSMVINATSGASGGVSVKYDAITNKLYLRNDQNSGWLGGQKPGAANVIENSRCKVYCANTAVTKSGTRIIVDWAIEFKRPMSGKTYPAWMCVVDTLGAVSIWEQKGTFQFK